VKSLNNYLEVDFVDVAPGEFFAGGNRFHDWVVGCLEMFGGVFIFRVVAAAYMSARQAKTKRDPRVTDFYAIFTDCDIFGMDVTDLVFVRAGFLLHRNSIGDKIVVFNNK